MISQRAFVKGMKSFGIQFESGKLEEIFDMALLDSQYEMTRSDFHRFLRGLEAKKTTNDEIEASFYVLDCGKGGGITGQNLRNVLLGIGIEITDTEMNTLIDGIPHQKENLIQMEEYKEYIGTDMENCLYPYKTILDKVDDILSIR